MNRFPFLLCLIILLSLFSLSAAGIPKLINYQGMLTDDIGDPITDTLDLDFRIYNAPSDGSLKWSETVSGVSVIDGLFNVILGTETDLELDFSEPYWLEVEVEAEIMPRVQFTSVAYAYRAKMADSATVAVSAPTAGGWTDDGTVVRLAVSSDSVGVGTTTPKAKLDLRGTLNVGEDGTGHNVTFFGEYPGSRMSWDQGTMAFRAGRDASGNFWIPDSMGWYSFATGYQTIALGQNSSALGYKSNARGTSSIAMGDLAWAGADYSVAIGRLAKANGHSATAMGRESRASGGRSSALGYYAIASGSTSVAIGYVARAEGDHSTAIGELVTAEATSSFVLGKGLGGGNPLLNDVSNSLMIGFNSTKPTLFVDGSSVGIGTTSPSETFEIHGSEAGETAFLELETSHASQFEETGIRFRTPAHTWHFRMDGYNHNNLPDTGSLALRSQTSGEVMVWTPDGNVGIGTTNPGSYKLAVNGTAAKTGGGSWSVFSDIRLKDIGEEYQPGLSEVLKLRPVYYNYKTNNKLGLPSGQRYVGLVAQAVQEIVPDAVSENHQGYLMLKNDPILWAMLNAIKELEAENNQLKLRIEALERR